MIPGEILTQASTRADLEARLQAHEDRIRGLLRRYDAKYAYRCLMDGIRTAEEVINLPFADWKDEKSRDIFLTRPLHIFVEHPDKLMTLHRHLTRQFSEFFANRMASLIQQATAMSMSFRQHGFPEVAAELHTIASLMGYFQSRRRHLVALMNLIPAACKGNDRLELWDALPVFLPIVEFEGIQLMGAKNCLIEKLCCERLGLPTMPEDGLHILDGLFLEPERARVTDMPWTDTSFEIMRTHEALAQDRLFSAAELRNDIKTIRAAYAEFDLSRTDFEAAARLVEQISKRFVERDFWVAISPENLKRLFSELDTPQALQKALTTQSQTYYDGLSSYAPFTLISGEYRSTITLLSRFIYYWRGQVLDRQKRFQIRSGFIFEKAVSQTLEDQGFKVQKITRVRRAEFDVVTLRGGTIWNFQCKNNWNNLEQAQANPDRYARFNRNYVRTYEQALKKEHGREHLLKERLNRSKIVHIVVSKFPVITDNPHILSFNRLRAFATIANKLEAKGQPLPVQS